ncbi:ribosome biogenesis GTPase YqeH [Sesbania bispinosa]|nr:ribosome biogenesis GTPase YqeH [Sesbania bispinosa]
MEPPLHGVNYELFVDIASSYPNLKGHILGCAPHGKNKIFNHTLKLALGIYL